MWFTKIIDKLISNQDKIPKGEQIGKQNLSNLIFLSGIVQVLILTRPVQICFIDISWVGLRFYLEKHKLYITSFWSAYGILD